MDAMAFGMGCCCLQVTFQARDVSESRHLYDALAVLAPIFLPLTAATPILKGKLSDWDARWNIIRDSVDCRTAQEDGSASVGAGVGEGGGAAGAAVVDTNPSTRDFTPTAEELAMYAGAGITPLSKSRYETIDAYICNHLNGEDPESESACFNDSQLPIDEEAYTRLVEGGADPLLAKHVAHLFVRDPLVLFEGEIEIDDEKRTDHFENLQSTNWNSVRWKPPPPTQTIESNPEKSIGWRTEFRSMDIQLTDFENAAFTVFITLASRVLLSFNLNTYIPVSKSDENMDRAHSRDAVTDQKFWFRSHLVHPDVSECPSLSKGDCCSLHGARV
jgi:glutamate--cysteine ligase catalytic subunit